MALQVPSDESTASATHDHAKVVRSRRLVSLHNLYFSHDRSGIRNFHVELPDTAWVTDVTYIWTHEGWLYLAAILDLFSRRVVGWAVSANNDRALAISALDRATIARIPAVGLVHHSDRGSVYASGDCGDALTNIGAVKSMSRKGDRRVSA